MDIECYIKLGKNERLVKLVVDVTDPNDYDFEYDAYYVYETRYGTEKLRQIWIDKYYSEIENEIYEQIRVAIIGKREQAMIDSL